MNTILVIFVAVALLFWCGASPALFLLRKRGPSRIAAIPAIGICSGVIFTYLLARLGFTGKTIAVLTLVFFGLLNTIAWRRCRPSVSEFWSFLPVWICCLAALAIASWPLVWMGYNNYWGFANPDHAFYLPVLQYLDTHPFGVVTPAHRGSFYEADGMDVSSIGYDSSVILGISYCFSMLSLLTQVPVVFLFGVVTAAVLCIVPASTFVVCDLGLQLPGRVPLVAAGLTACSSLVAYTLYLHSLGTMTVIAILPVGIAVTLDYFRDPRLDKLALVAVIVAGMYYAYFAGAAILALAMASAALAAMCTRKCDVRSVFFMIVGCLAAVVAIWSAQALTIFTRLIRESSGGSQFSRTNELLVTFALVLTEKGLPLFWGLRFPSSDLGLFGPATFGFDALLGASAVLFFALGLSMSRRLSGVSTEYICSLGGVLGLVLVYAISGSGGYGAFKIVTWIHPLVLAGLTASMIGSWNWLRLKRQRVFCVLPLAVLGVYVTFNLINAFRLGRESMGGATATMSNAPQLRLKDFSELQKVADRWGQDGIVVALPDPVAQSWLIPFFRHSVTQFFPLIHLGVEDSQPRPARPQPMGKYVLHWADKAQDLTAFPVSATIWRNDKLALTPLTACRDIIIPGLGWYRKEAVYNSPLEWQHHFRWLRKRGELLILNPSLQPKRIVLNLIAGYGNPSPMRHIDLYLNGVKFDEIDFCAAARVLTRPFVASAPWSQVELAVREDASPLPREHPLWNRWVPGDPRRLNIAVAECALIDASQAGSLLTSSIDFGPSKRTTGMADGVYQDGWISKKAEIALRVPTTPVALEISGMIPTVRTYSFPYQIDLSLDGVRLTSVRIENPGAFNVRVSLDGRTLLPGHAARLTLGPLATFSGSTLGLSDDPRILSLLLNRVAFVVAEAGDNLARQSPSRN